MVETQSHNQSKHTYSVKDSKEKDEKNSLTSSLLSWPSELPVMELKDSRSFLVEIEMWSVQINVVSFYVVHTYQYISLALFIINETETGFKHTTILKEHDLIILSYNNIL